MHHEHDHPIITHDAASFAAWSGAAIAFTVLVARLAAHREQQRGLDAAAYIVLCSLFFLVARTVVNALILRGGTLLHTPGSDDESMVRTSSILVLCARVFVTTFYWLQSISLLIFYREMMSHIPWIHHAIKLCWSVIGSTYLAVILATFLECRPVQLYWTATRDGPHECTRAYVQVVSQCISTLAIDFLLLLITAPILKAQARVFPRNLQLGTLYLLGTFCIIVVALKIHFIYKDHSAQLARSFWASIQVAVSAFVANAPSIYGAAKNVKRRRSSSMSTARSRTGDSDYFDIASPPVKPPVLTMPRWDDEPVSRPALVRFGEPKHA